MIYHLRKGFSATSWIIINAKVKLTETNIVLSGRCAHEHSTMSEIVRGNMMQVRITTLHLLTTTQVEFG